jgi:DNA-binding transcriptional LysR family regulator
MEAAMLDLRQVRSFVTVAREGSVTRAAELLNYAQSSVTAQIHALEEELGVPLFDRVGRGVSLTNVGADFMVHAERVLGVAEEARLSVRSGGEPSGRLTIAASESLLTYRLPELLRTFQCKFPAVEIVLHTSSVCASEVVIDPGVDLAITIDVPVLNPELAVETLREERMVCVVAKEHALAGMQRVTAEQMSAHQILLTERTCSYRGVFERTLAQAGSRVSKSLEFASVEAMKQCAVARMGVAVLPEFVVADELERGELVVVPWPARNLYVYTQILRNREKWFSPAAQAFWTNAVELLRKRKVALAGELHEEGRGRYQEGKGAEAGVELKVVGSVA